MMKEHDHAPCNVRSFRSDTVVGKAFQLPMPEPDPCNLQLLLVELRSMLLHTPTTVPQRTSAPGPLLQAL